MNRPRKILHLDLDAFFCAVEEQRNPALRGKAFAVGGRPEERGVVASCSYAARQFGVHSAMPMSQALRRCPHLLIVGRNFADYKAASRKVMALLYDLTPLVEQLSIDEAFLDVSALEAPAETLARQLQARINQQLGLPCSLGVASNKLVAKIANNLGKAGAQRGTAPNSIKVIAPGQEAAFLAPLPSRELWGVGPKTAEKLAHLGLHTIGDIAAWDEQGLITHFGKHGADLYRHAQGIDERPIETTHEIKSVSRETTFTQDVRDAPTLHNTLRELAEDLAAALQREQLRGATIKIKLRWQDFTTITRQTTLERPTARRELILATALQLLEQTWAAGRAVRLIGVGVSGFEEASQAEAAPPAPRQLSLWEQPTNPALRDAVQKLQARFGEDAVQRGKHLAED